MMRRAGALEKDVQSRRAKCKAVGGSLRYVRKNGVLMQVLRVDAARTTHVAARDNGWEIRVATQWDLIKI